MPALGMSQDTGRLVRWLKNEGDEVQRGEPLMEVETDKAVVEVEAPGEGVLGGIRAREGDEIPVGRTIAYLLAPGESPPAQDVEAAAGAAPSAGAVRDGSPAGPPADLVPERPAERAPRAAASPKARRLAMQRGLDLSNLVGSGPGGAVLESDLEMGPARIQESPLWRAMAENTTRSWQQTPHFFLFRDVDARQLLEARGRVGA